MGIHAPPRAGWKPTPPIKSDCYIYIFNTLLLEELNRKVTISIEVLKYSFTAGN